MDANHVNHHNLTTLVSFEQENAMKLRMHSEMTVREKHDFFLQALLAVGNYPFTSDETGYTTRWSRHPEKVRCPCPIDHSGQSHQEFITGYMRRFDEFAKTLGIDPGSPTRDDVCDEPNENWPYLFTQYYYYWREQLNAAARRQE